MSNKETDAPEEKGERIAKVMARAGLCSRRDAERWIAEGRVSVDGNVLTSPALAVTSANTIVVDGKPLPGKSESRLWRYHKPSGLVTSHKDEKDRPTVFQKIPKELGRVISVGRLDLTTEGLLLLTNDGELARKLEMPSTGWIRRYRVRVHGTVDPKKLEALQGGVTVEGVRYGPIEASLENAEGQKSANTWLAVAITEGKNREIRKVMDHIGLEVNRLIRISYGPFQLGTLRRGEVDEIRSHVIRGAISSEKPSHGKGFAKAKPKLNSIKHKHNKNKKGMKKPDHADRSRKA
ncbi:MAG: rRNA pseudouridine synthase [Rhodospirillales bacterium]|nr:rRNA pseudouridine synthase [Rhodospirillales bacterium]